MSSAPELYLKVSKVLGQPKFLTQIQYQSSRITRSYVVFLWPPKIFLKCGHLEKVGYASLTATKLPYLFKTSLFNCPTFQNILGPTCLLVPYFTSQYFPFDRDSKSFVFRASYVCFCKVLRILNRAQQGDTLT